MHTISSYHLDIEQEEMFIDFVVCSMVINVLQLIYIIIRLYTPVSGESAR